MLRATSATPTPSGRGPSEETKERAANQTTLQNAQEAPHGPRGELVSVADLLADMLALTGRSPPEVGILPPEVGIPTLLQASDLDQKAIPGPSPGHAGRAHGAGQRGLRPAAAQRRELHRHLHDGRAS